MRGGQGWKARFHKGRDAWICGAAAISVWRKPSHQSTPVQLTALPTDTVEVTDPTHPLYGLTFPLIGITTKQRLGRVCAVWLYPGLERVIPITATNLGGNPVVPSPCRLCVEGLQALLAVVASWEHHPQEDCHVDSTCSSDAAQPTTRFTLARAGRSVPTAADRTTSHSTSAPVEESLDDQPVAGASDHPANSTGDAS
jgi:hypothetical protein